MLLAGCAGVTIEPPRIERLSAEQLEARLPPPAAAMPLEQVVVLSKQGVPAADLIERIKASGSRYRLSATQLVELARDGVALAVLDHLVAVERHRIFDELAADANQREQACRERIAQEVQACRNQYFGPMLVPAPYPMFNCFPLGPSSPYWRCM